MKAVILAAGKGTRLFPFTEKRPKQLIPLAGKPLIGHILSSLKSIGIIDVLIIIGKGGGSIKKYVESKSGRVFHLEFEEQDHPRGTADALKYSRDFIGSQPFFITYGDVIHDSKILKGLIALFAETGETVITTAEVEEPRYFGLIQTKGPIVTKLIEKPAKKPAGTSLVNAGGYIFTHTIFDCIESLNESTRGELELTDAINKLILKGTKIRYLTAKGNEWLHVDHPWDILTANEHLLSRIEESRKEVKEYTGINVEGLLKISKAVKIKPGTFIEGPVYIGNGSELGPNCLLRAYTCIGDQVKIGSGCEIKNSIIMSNTKVSHLSYIGDSVIGENCNLGAGTITANLRFDEKTIKMIIKKKSLDTGKRKFGAVLGDNVKTGVNVSIMPGVKIGVNSAIGPNMIVTHDVPDNTLLTVRQHVTYKTFKDLTRA